VREYGFELSLCARLEREREAVVARQVGGGVHRPGGRVLDVVLVEPGPEFRERAAITSDRIPVDAVESDVGPGRWRRPTAAIDAHPERAREITERAVAAGFFESTYRGGHRLVRQVTRYPDWFDRMVAVENKPDLDRPGALETQLRTDVALGVVDQVVLATASHVTGAHLNRLPPAVGVWQYRPGADSCDPGIEVIREASPLDPDEPGVELLDRHPGRDEIAVASADRKARARRRIAERAYGKGWRLPADAWPACDRVETGAGCAVPHCTWKGRIVDPRSECGPDCPGHDPAPPPSVDPAEERDRRTPWVTDPDGRTRRQSGLDRYFHTDGDDGFR